MILTSLQVVSNLLRNASHEHRIEFGGKYSRSVFEVEGRGTFPARNGSNGNSAMMRQLKLRNPRITDATNSNFNATPTHSSRSRIKGLTDSARLAGIQVATSPNSSIARTTPASTSGSRGVA